VSDQGFSHGHFPLDGTTNFSTIQVKIIHVQITHLEIGVADVFPIGRRLFLQSGNGMHQHGGSLDRLENAWTQACRIITIRQGRVRWHVGLIGSNCHFRCRRDPVETTLIHGNENSIGLDHLYEITWRIPADGASHFVDIQVFIREGDVGNAGIGIHYLKSCWGPHLHRTGEGIDQEMGHASLRQRLW